MRKNAHGLFVFVDDYLFNEVMSHFSMLKNFSIPNHHHRQWFGTKKGWENIRRWLLRRVPDSKNRTVTRRKDQFSSITFFFIEHHTAFCNMHALAAVEKGQTLICAVSKSCAIVCCVHTHDHRKKSKGQNQYELWCCTQYRRNMRFHCSNTIVCMEKKDLLWWRKLYTYTHRTFFPSFPLSFIII